MDERGIYVQCGLTMRSELALHLPEAPGEHWDVDISWGPDLDDSSEPPPGEVVAGLELPEGGWWYRATSTGDGYRLRFHDCGEFVVSDDLRCVQVRRAPTEQSSLLPVLLAGTVSSFLLTLRGATVLHASAVLIDGTALAFVGQSGQGKTTLATLLCLDGARLVTDDVLAVDAGPPVTCIGGASELRLREGAAALATERPAGASRTTEDDRVALSVAMAPPSSHPLGAIVFPEPTREISDLRIRRVPPSTALVALLAFPRIYGWSQPDVLVRDFSALGALANEVPIYVATVPWGPPFDPSVAPALAGLVRGAGHDQDA